MSLCLVVGRPASVSSPPRGPRPCAPNIYSWNEQVNGQVPCIQVEEFRSFENSGSGLLCARHVSVP